MNGKLEFSSYHFDEYDELCLISGSQHQIKILLVPPLFDEMNRMRRALVDAMHLLDECRIGSILPDLPGTNESLFPQGEANLTLWRSALNMCISQHTDCKSIASFRGGCLIDDFDCELPRWRFSPAKGRSMLRTMMRTRIASDKEAGNVTKMTDLQDQAISSNLNLAGNIIGPSMFAELDQAEPITLENTRVVRLESDSADADVKLAGSALWLRAEPDADQLISTAMANDLASWINS
ncbi:hypothetical protein [Parasphingorhabdus halotolerans]|uniref:Uncharacterized protein n=1 Tax=Parasphingorhabdus halotolerans TaxID=2725558 RepID=A0A6H2DL25_9SPHN|nr:hypothetical protein [Parasphingorhabdus halotolerans]QJB68451.1 hypothetical protein HF685_03315 [Parasphingorhabdus halotolerans]